MGMAASQVRLLQLTGEKIDITRTLANLANQKMSLARDSQKITNEYQKALNQKVLKWSNNSGVSYINLNYQNLMNPGIINQNSLNLITDLDGKPVISENYLEYAKRISPEGNPGGNWESNRTEILSELTGIDAETIENMEVYQNNVNGTGAVLDRLNAEEPQKPYLKESFSDILTAITALPFPFEYNPSEKKYKINTEEELNNFIKSMQAFGETLADADLYKKLVEEKIKELYNNKGQRLYSIENLVKDIFKQYFEAGGEAVAYCNGDNNYSSASFYYNYDKDSPEYKEWEIKHAEWNVRRYAALDGHNNAINDNNQLLTGEEEKLIEFYDRMFSTIAEKGWTYNSRVESEDYLNNMLQNGLYTITTVKRNTDCEEYCDDKQWENSYTTNIAGNNPNIFAVNAENEDAMTKYQIAKENIKTKETQIDTRMTDLQTRLEAIQNFIKSVNEVIKSNTDRTFSSKG